MSSVQQSIRPGGETGAMRGGSMMRLATRFSWPLICGLMLLLAVVIGGALGTVTVWPTSRLIVVCGGLTGLLGMVAWPTLRLSLIPPLRLALLISPFLLLAQITLFVDPEVKWGQSGLTVSLMLIASVMLGLAYLGQRWMGQARERIFPPSFSLAVVGLCSWSALSAVYGASGWKGICGLWGMATSVLMCFLIAHYFSDREALRGVVICLALLLLLNCALGFLQPWSPKFNLWQQFVAPDLDWSETLSENTDVTRISGMFVSSTSFGWALTTCAPVMLSMLLLRVEGFRRWQRSLLIVSSIMSVIALVMTYARGGWIAFGVSLLILPALAYRVLPRPERGRFTFTLAGVCLAMALLCLPFVGRIYERLTEDDRGAAYVRVPLAEVAVEMIENNPVLGVGLNCYESEMRRYDHTSESITDTLPSAVHNMYLYIAAETGVVGCIFFLALIASSLWQGWLALRKRDPFLSALSVGLMTGLAAFLLNGLKEPGWLGGYMLHFCFLFCGLLIAVNRASRKAEPGMRSEAR